MVVWGLLLKTKNSTLSPALPTVNLISFWPQRLALSRANGIAQGHLNYEIFRPSETLLISRVKALSKFSKPLIQLGFNRARKDLQLE